MKGHRLGVVLLPFLVLAQACSSVSPRQFGTQSGKASGGDEAKQGSSLETTSAGTRLNPDQSPLEPALETHVEPERSQDDPTTGGVSIIAGPGWYRAWFLAGALMEFNSAKVPIREIYASEMSALIAVLFSSDSREGSFTWKIQSLKEECFAISARGSLSRFFSEDTLDAACIRKSLGRLLGSQKIENLPIPVRVAAIDTARSNFVSFEGAVEWRGEGQADQAILAGLAFPRLLHLEGASEPAGKCGILCGSVEGLFPVKKLSSEAGGKLVVFNFGSAPPEIEMESQSRHSGLHAYVTNLSQLADKAEVELKGFEPVVRPFGPDHPVFEPTRRNDYLYMGRKAARSLVSTWTQQSQAP